MCSQIKKLITGRESRGSDDIGGKGIAANLAYWET